MLDFFLCGIWDHYLTYTKGGILLKGNSFGGVSATSIRNARLVFDMPEAIRANSYLCDRGERSHDNSLLCNPRRC